MGLKFSMDIMEQRPCCNNCVFVVEQGQEFGCKKNVAIEDNHFTKMNFVVCDLHSYFNSKRFQNRKLRRLKSKSKKTR